MNDKQIQVITIQNPFNPADRLTRSVSFRPGLPVSRYVEEALRQADPGVELVVSRNGRRLSEADLARVQPRPGDYLLIAPAIHGGGDGGKNLAATLAGLVLMVVTMGVGSLAAGGAFMGAGWLAPAAWGWWGYLAAIGTTLAGGWLLSTLFPPPEAKDPAPGWNSLSPIQGQGSVVGETFGTTRTGGTVLQQRIVPDGDKQYLYYLATGGAGEIDDIGGVKIGKNPVENYNDVQLEYRLGTNDQTVIPGFDDTLQTQILSYNLQEGADWSTQQTTEATGTGLEVILECPVGLYRREDDGDLKTATVRVELQYRKVGDPDWIPWAAANTHTWNRVGIASSKVLHLVAAPSSMLADLPPGQPIMVKLKNRPDFATTVVSAAYSGDSGFGIVLIIADDITVKPYSVYWTETESYFQIEAATSSPVRRTYRIDGLEAAQYEVRARCIYKSGTGDRYATDVYWTALSHVITDDFIRPGKVLVAVKALATDQLQGVLPEITWLQTRENVWVWDPSENGGAGGYVQKPAYNPAWAAYDLIHRCRSIRNIHTGAYEFVVKGYPASRILYQEFADWADFCTARDLRFDYYYDQEMTLWDALKLPESLGRGKALMRGTRWGAMWDGPAEVSMQFDAGNITLDSFGLDYQGAKNRARALEIRFRDAALDYEWNYVPVIPPGYDASLVPANPTRIDLPGCTRLDQAYREGRYRLWLNSLVRMASWRADVDAIGCQIGQRVRVAHDVLLPETSVSGRLVDADADSVTLDRAVTLEPGKDYVAALRLPDDTLIEKSMENQAALFDRNSTAYLDGVEYPANAPRFLPGGGVMVEEGTTNLLTANQASVETDLTGFSAKPSTDLSRDTSEHWHGAASLKVVCAGVVINEGFGSSLIAFAGGPIITFSVWLKGSGTVRLRVSDNAGHGTVAASDAIALTSTWTRYSCTGASYAGATGLFFNVETTGTVQATTFYADGLQLEQKPYATSWHLPGSSRAHERLTLPNSGLSPAAGTLVVDVEIGPMARRQVPGQYPEIFWFGIGWPNGMALFHQPTAARFALETRDEANNISSVAFDDSLIPDGHRRLWFTWDGAAKIVRLYCDANPTPIAVIEDAKMPSAPAFAIVTLGGRRDTTMLNEPIYAARLSSAPWGAEGLSDAGTPLSVDEHTLGLWTFDHSLACQTQHVRVTEPFAADTEPAEYEDGTHFLVAGDRTAAYAGGETIILEHDDGSEIAVVVGSVYDPVEDETSVEIAGDVEESLSTVRYAYTQPRRFDNYAFGEVGRAAKDFRLLSIRRSGDLQYELAGIEYAEHEEPADIPAPIIVEPVGGVTHLRATETLESGTRWCNVSWIPPRDNYTGARIVVDGKQVGRVGIEITTFRFPLEVRGTITIMVTALDRWGRDYGSASIQFDAGDTIPPPAVTAEVVSTPDGLYIDITGAA